MQLRIAKLLNKLLAVIGLLIIAGGVMLYFFLKLYPNLTLLFVLIFVVVSVLLMIIFRWFESQWDKKVITRMTRDGKIALANITGAQRVMPMRDTAFTSYWLYEFKSDMYDENGNKFEKTFYEKMNCETGEVPSGSVYVTYDEEKPGQIFIIPNMIIGYMPHLAPIVKRYEDDKSIPVKYLDAYYNKGIVLKSYSETVSGNTGKKTGNKEVKRTKDENKK